MQLEGLKLSTTSTVEILSAYAAPQREIIAVDATPGWYVVGAFQMNKTAKIRLELIGSVSDVDLTLRARLFDIDAGQPVSGSTVQISSMTDARALSGVFQLTGQAHYQMQAEVTGDSGDELFGTVRSVAVVNE